MLEDSPSLVLEVVGSLGRPINLNERKKEKKKRDEKLRRYQYIYMSQLRSAVRHKQIISPVYIHVHIYIYFFSFSHIYYITSKR